MNAKDNTVQSAYLISTSEGHLELLNLTLKHGADVDSKDSFNGTGLIRAADRGHADIAGRLVQADDRDRPHQQPGLDRPARGDHPRRRIWRAMSTPCGSWSPPALTYELRSQRDQITPIEHATSKGHREIAQVLRAALEADRPSKQQANRRLLAAAERGDATAAALAIRAGASLETRDDRDVRHCC